MAKPVKSGHSMLAAVGCGLVVLTACGAPVHPSATATPSASASQQISLSWDAQGKLLEIGDAVTAELGSSFGGDEIDQAAGRLVVHFNGSAEEFAAAQSTLASQYGSLVELVRAVQSHAAALKLKDSIAAALQSSPLDVSQIAPLPDGTVRVWTSGDPAVVLAAIAKDGIRVRNPSGQPVVDVVRQDVAIISPA